MAAIAVRKLPRSLQKALEAIAYNRPDVEVCVQSEVSLSGEGQSFYIVNLANGEHRVPKKSERGHAARLGRSAAVIQTSQGSHGAVATIYVGQASAVPMLRLDEKRPEAVRFIPGSEDIARVNRGAAVVASVNRQREIEYETAKLAEMVGREHKRRDKSDDAIDNAAADEALARAEIILRGAESKVRMVQTFDRATGELTGRAVPAGAIRETLLKRLNIEFGCNAPIYVTCANCQKVFAVKAGTSPHSTPKTCKRGCLCACGRSVTHNAAILAARMGRRAKCQTCQAARTHCPKGHDLEVVGRRFEGRCAECGREANRARLAARKADPSLISTKKTHCVHGHDLAVVGRRIDGSCVKCHSERQRVRQAAKTAAKAKGQ